MQKLALTLGMAVICGGLLSSAVHAETVVFSSENRAYLGDWVISQNGGACPLGSTMVKKDHWLRSPSYRCVVPRTADNQVVIYAPGTTIPETVTYSELPKVVIDRLPAAPEGELYVSSHGNIYLIQPSSRTVIDSVGIVGPED